MQEPTAIPFGLYIHFPWCVRKCPYCDFNSHEVKSGLPEREYIDALLRDLEQALPAIWGRSIQSIFMGGGTPSLFSPESIDYLLSQLRAQLNFSPTIEVTLEANPGTAEQGKFSEFNAAGINRLSIGIQSFDDEQLQKLGRIHNRREAFRAAEMAHAAGFDQLNLDLMFGLPKQNTAAALSDLQNAIDLEPGHLSHYQLTIEPNTLFHHQPPPVPDDDLLFEMQQQCQTLLTERGYTQYEVSAYAKPGHRCQHNLNYWQFGDYLGLGAGAHSKLSQGQPLRITRQWRIRHPQDYLDKVGNGQHLGGQQVLSESDLQLEFMMNALRLVDGFDKTLFSERTGLSLETIETPLAKAIEAGLLNEDQQHFWPGQQGLQYLNELLQYFMP
jgi:oxygen-independent coproporphyrinogen-3 oxidase